MTMETIKIEFPIKNANAFTESQAVASMVEGLKKLLDIGALKGDLDKIVQNYEISYPGGWAVAIIDKSALVDASKLNTVGSGLSFPMEWTPEEVIIKDRAFSAATIQERMRIAAMQPKMKFRYTVLDYKKYYKATKSKMKDNPELMKRLKDMFIVDMMGIFTQVLPYIQEGKQLSQLTGLTTITDGLNSISKELSLAYRRALKQAKGGQISPSVFKELQAKYTTFMNLLITQVFPGIEEINMSGTDNKSFSTKTSGTVVVQTSNPDLLGKILNYIDEVTRGGHSATIVVDKGQDKEKEFTWDGDGSDRINSVSVSKSETTVSYSTTRDGRLKLFD